MNQYTTIHISSHTRFKTEVSERVEREREKYKWIGILHTTFVVMGFARILYHALGKKWVYLKIA